MAHTSEVLEFSYNGQPVGYFEEPTFPSSSCRARYMPYRGAGHYEMQLALRSKGKPRCVGGPFSFSVVACPEYGVLELADFAALGDDE